MNEFMGVKIEVIAQIMIRWAEQWQAHILKHGAPLDDEQMRDAECVGVAAPEKVRVLEVPNVPMPPQRILHSTLIKSGIFSFDACGLTLEYGIFIKIGGLPLDYWLTHELVHVGQYERMGGLKGCLPQYLEECLTIGYENNNLELEAHQTALRCLAQKGIHFDF